MSTYAKLSSSITDSSLWVMQPHHVRIVWITLLAMKDKDGFVASSVPGLARRAVVTLTECEEALAVFMAPDKYSRTPDHDGRRIEAVQGGWIVLNHAIYRDLMSADSERARKAQWAKDRREKNLHSCLPVANDSDVSTSLSVSVSEYEFESEDPEGVQGEPVGPRKSRFAPADLEMDATQLTRCQELKFDPVQILRDFKLHEFNRTYTDWPRRLSKWIEEERVRRETEAAKKLERARGGPTNNDAWQPTARARAYAQKHGKDIDSLLPSYRAERHPEELSRQNADTDFERRLVCLVKTGKWIPTGALPQRPTPTQEATG